MTVCGRAKRRNAAFPEHEVGSGNVFADIGRPDAETHLLKAQLVSRIQDILAERRLSQVKAAEILGIAQPVLSNILRGRFRGYSVERIMRFLTALGCAVEIIVHSPGEPAGTAAIHLRPAGLHP